MTTKFSLPKDPSQTQAEYELTPVGIEDIDRALFKLFDTEIPFAFEHKGETKDIPVIFATGERAFILNRKEPLTDRSGALILPLISILRNGLSQTPEMGMGIGPGTGRIVLEKNVHADSAAFLKENNQDGLLNQSNVVGANKHIGPSKRNYARNVPMGNNYLSLQSSQKITEILSIPSARYFTLKYEVTFWAQYLQQMNRMLEALMISYTHNPGRSFKLETDKGYWFVAYVDADLNQDFNFDGMTDEERLVKASFGVTVNGYLLNPMHSGIPNLVSRTLSSPRISFETSMATPITKNTVNVPSSNPADYTYQDYEVEGTPVPGSGIGGGKINRLSAEAAATIGGTNASTGQSATGGGLSDAGSSANVGGFTAESRNPSSSDIIRYERWLNPLTGEWETRPVKIKTKTSRHGEKIFRMLSIND